MCSHYFNSSCIYIYILYIFIDIYEDGLSTAEMLYYEVASLDNHIPLYTATISQTPPVIVASENKSYAGPFEKLRSNRRIRTKKSNNDDSKETVDAMHTCYDYSKSIVPDSMDWFSTVHQVYYEHARFVNSIFSFNSAWLLHLSCVLSHQKVDRFGRL